MSRRTPRAAPSGLPLPAPRAHGAGRVPAWAQAGTAALLLLVGAACGGPEAPSPDPAAPAEAVLPLVPHTAAYDQVSTLPRDPATDPLPDDAFEAEQVRLGYQIVRDPQQYAAAFVGNEMRCGNCHLNGGQRERALPYVGIAGVFPEYRARDGRLIDLASRIGDCFERSLNGPRPPNDSPEVMAVAAYIAWLSEGQPVGKSPAWRGQNQIAPEARIPIEALDVARGEQAYRTTCTACHDADGRGIDIGGPVPGPLWGEGSWNDGAGAARVYTLAGYIRYAMPLTSPGILSDEDAQHIAAFINAHERPSFPRKAQDFPNGDVPIDAVYYPQRYAQNPLRRHP